MQPPTRREWLARALAGAGVAGARSLFAQPARRWGVQLYTVRGVLAKDPAGTLERIAAIGYRELEILQGSLEVVAPIAARLGLSVVSVHLGGPTAAGEGLAAFAARAKAHGIRHLVVPFVPPADRPRDGDGFRRLAERLARMAGETRDAGLELGYHNHAFEFTTGADGARWLDVLMQETAAAGLKLQLDVFWTAVAGADPVSVIRPYADRLISLHLKDKAPGLPPALGESQVPREAFVEVGSGSLDMPAILAAARTAGVQHFFVEQDQTPGDPIESLRKSYAYLAMR
jgi:sugar phosphate isomerase/epimerase